MDTPTHKGFADPQKTSSPLVILAVAIVYAVVAKMSFLVTIPPGNISPIFPSAGIALAAALIWGRPALCGIWLGSFLANAISFFDGTVSPAPGVLALLLISTFVGLGAVSGAGMGALLVQHFCQGPSPLHSGRNVLILLLVGALGCCLISPTFGVLSLSLGGYIPWKRFAYSWLTWWMGDAVGAIVTAPLILAWHHSFPTQKTLWRLLETALLGGVILLLSFMVFFRNIPLEYALMPLLLWAAFRFGMRGASTAAAAIALFATIGTSHGSSPFATDSVNESLLLLHSFLGVTIICALFLAGLLAERKRGEDLLRESENRLHLATTAGNIGIWDWDIQADRLAWDDSMYALYGIRKEDFGGAYEAWSRTLHPEDRQYAEGEIQAALRGEREYAPEFRIVLPDGAVRIVKAASQTIRDPDGRPLRMIGTNTDITERQQAKEELAQHRDHLEAMVKERTDELRQARDTAESANRAKSAFLANTSHEIKTPMNAILGFAQILERDPSLSAIARNEVTTIKKSGEHLLAIINDILEMSRIEAGRIEVHAECFDPLELLHDLAAMFRLLAEKKGLTFSLECTSSLPHYIVADMGKIRQVTMNLLTNAVKFTKEGSVALRAMTMDHEWIAIEVADTGPGIAMADQAALFQPFERFSNSEQVSGGTGLGLAISHEYARLIGAEISVSSTVGQGSCFRFAFPAPVSATAPQPAVSARQVTGIAPGQGEIRILVVDDQVSNRKLLHSMLTPLGFIVDEASNGDEAIERFRSARPRIVLMDLVMPGMDGAETTKRLRTIMGGEPCAIIGISASAMIAERGRFLDSGIDAFIAKPFREQELYDAMEAVGGVLFIADEITSHSPLPRPTAKDFTLDKLSAEWCDAFGQALVLGNISKMRRLSEEAKGSDPLLAEFLLERVALYDLNELKKLFTVS